MSLLFKVFASTGIPHFEHQTAGEIPIKTDTKIYRLNLPPMGQRGPHSTTYSGTTRKYIWNKKLTHGFANPGAKELNKQHSSPYHPQAYFKNDMLSSKIS